MLWSISVAESDTSLVMKNYLDILCYRGYSVVFDYLSFFRSARVLGVGISLTGGDVWKVSNGAFHFGLSNLKFCSFDLTKKSSWLDSFVSPFESYSFRNTGVH